MTEEKKPAPKKKKPADATSPAKPTTSEARAKPARAAGREPPHDRDAGAPKSTNVALFVVLALVAGGAVGWFARDRSAGAEAGPDPEALVAAAGSASAGAAMPPACEEWTNALCEGAGKESEGCMQARSAAGIMPGSACAAAKAELPATLEKLKAARGACDALVVKLCSELGEETETCKMVREKTPMFPTKQCSDMMANYDSVIGELRNMEKQNAPLSAEVAEKQRAGDGPSFGPADAKVAIVEYSDFECPFCSRAAAAVKQLKERYGDKVRFVFRQYPLPMHSNAQVAAEASLAAHAQGKFWALHDAMFENQRALDRASLEGYAEKAGLDMGKFKKDLDDKKYADVVKADMKLGEEIGVSGTPTMIVGTKRVANPSDFASISKIVDAELTAAGVPLPE